MKVIMKPVVALLCSTLAFAYQANADPDNSGDLAGLSGRVFLAEVTIQSSPFFPEFEGAVFPTCYFFEEDGTWIDLEWPGEGAPPVPGVWVQHTELPHVSFTATAPWPAVGWTLILNGSANPARGQGNQKYQSYAMVFGVEQELIFYITSEGHAVDSCPL